MPKDEVWTTRDGTKIPVGEMSEDHVRNALRMILRNRRKQLRQVLDDLYDDDIGNGQDILNAQYARDLSNPACFFPLLDGGVYGSPELAARHRR